MNVIYCTNDNGYAAHKVCYYDEDTRRIRTHKIDAVICAGLALSTTVGENVDGYSVKDGAPSQKYTCSGTTSKAFDTRVDDYPVSIVNRVLFTHALHQAGLFGKPLRMSVTLPLADYYLPSGAVNSNLVQRVVENFSANNIVPEFGEFAQQTADVQFVRVSPEAVSAWFDWAMDEHGEVNENYEQMLENEGVVLIVDVGGSTTDIVALTLTPDLTVLNEKSGTRKLGVLDVQAQMVEGFLEQRRQEGVIQDVGHEEVLSAKQKQSMPTATRIFFGGVAYDITELRKQCVASVADQIASFIRETSGNPLSYHGIVVVGGGSVVFREMLAERLGPGAAFLDEYSNARGALKLMLSMRE